MKSLLRVAVVATLAVPAHAADRLGGTASLNADTASFAHGVGTWHAPDAELSLGFFPEPPIGAEQAHLVVELVFEEGTTIASADKVVGCHLGFYDFKGGPFDYNGGKDHCGTIDVSGELKDGGTVTGKLTGKGGMEAMGSLPATNVTWDVSFTATLRESDASVEMEAAFGPQAKKLSAGGGDVGTAFVAEKCAGRGLFGMKNCKVLGGREEGSLAFLSVDADTMGARMRNEFLLVKDGATWKVAKEGAWRSAPQ